MKSAFLLVLVLAVPAVGSEPLNFSAFGGEEFASTDLRTCPKAVCEPFCACADTTACNTPSGCPLVKPVPFPKAAKCVADHCADCRCVNQKDCLNGDCPTFSPYPLPVEAQFVQVCEGGTCRLVPVGSANASPPVEAGAFVGGLFNRDAWFPGKALFKAIQNRPKLFKGRCR